MTESNPAQSVRAPKSTRRLPRALDVDQMITLLEQTPQTPLVDDAFMGDDTLAVEVPYAIEVRGAEKP